MSKLQPGDLDRMRFAFLDIGDISTRGLIRASGLPPVRGRAALDELVRIGEADNAEGHDHDRGDFCQCKKGGGSKLIHWYLRSEVDPCST